MNLGQVIDSAVRKFGSRIAFSDPERRLTFKEADERSRRLGNALIALGMERGSRIATLQYNAIEIIEFDLCAARFGFVRSLLNARSDAQAHLQALQDCEARVLVFGEKHTAVVEGLRPSLDIEHYICVGNAPRWAVRYEDLIAAAPADGPTWEVGEDDLHSIYFTSGTTGRAKGVVLSQRNWLVVIRNHLMDLYTHTGPDDVVLHAAPLSHASGVMMFSQLARGARQHVMERFDPGEALAIIERERVTTVYLAPTMVYKLLDHEDIGRRDLSSLRMLRYGGAPMAAERAKEAIARFGPVLAQAYGQWEAPQIFTVFTREQHVEALETGKLHRLMSAGMAMTYAEVGIMDDAGNLLPPGSEGEIVTAGDHLMVGYLNQPEETAALRVGKWQRTGDIGRMDADGYIYLTDRKKDFIITGGNNVYPREIEEVLYAHPSVHEAVAVGIPDQTWGETVHAVVVLKDGQSTEPDVLLEWCRTRLPTDKRPRSISFMSDLPKSAYGKILRREVRDPFWKGMARRI